jgi:hypothetical protein
MRGGMGDYDRALRLLYEVLAVSEQTGSQVGRAVCLNTLGWIYGDLQDQQRALRLNTDGVRAALAMQTPWREMESNAHLNTSSTSGSWLAWPQVWRRQSRPSRRRGRAHTAMLRLPVSHHDALHDLPGMPPLVRHSP